MTRSIDTTLPRGFESLEGFVAEWALDGMSTRLAKRYESTIEELTGLYDAVLPHAADAIEYLKGQELGAMPPEGERLLRLMLMLQEIAPSIEWYGHPVGPDCYDYRRVSVPVEIADVEAQV